MKKKLKNKLIQSKCILEIETYRELRLAAIQADTSIRNYIKIAVLERLAKDKK